MLFVTDLLKSWAIGFVTMAYGFLRLWGPCQVRAQYSSFGLGPGVLNKFYDSDEWMQHRGKVCTCYIAASK